MPRGSGPRSHKHKRDVSDTGGSTLNARPAPEAPQSRGCDPQFLDLPTDAERKACYAQFYEATSNGAIELCICGVCTCECAVLDDKVIAIPLSLIPNSMHLIPARKHVAHNLYRGRLLEPKGVVGEDDDPIMSVCGQCMEELKKPGHKPPKLSLANGLWIGRIPWALQVLTFPEQLLIALLYPHVYVFKLFPKYQQGARDMATLQRAMQGNVTAYELNGEAIASMVEGKLMPRPPVILASLISVMFIALGEIPKKWLHSTFHVRHQVVLEALRWLKMNNPKYYRDIEISPTQINTLPEDDMPEEITAIIRQSDDVGVLEEENNTYVHLDDKKGQSIIQIRTRYDRHTCLQ